MKNIKKNIGIILYVIIVIILTCIMFWAINKKEGFHEDEMFSYGASNSTLGNTFLSYGRVDNIDTVIKSRNPIKTLINFIHYMILDRDSYNQIVSELKRDDFKSVWRSREDAIEYLQIDNIEEALDFGSVYWNTAKDVHPPLFYFVVHIVSILFWGRFSKYIIFYINLAFYIGTLIILAKIFDVINKKNLKIPNLILYGASIGAISTVMFQRMYMMLTFFTIWFLYINLKIYYNNFKLTKNLNKELIWCTVLGFLTQYNFCFYAIFMALTIVCIGLYNKNKENIKIYFLQLVKSAIIGILIFLPCIYHIFFSYRGVGGDKREFTMYEALKAFAKRIFSAYSINFDLGIIISCVLFLVFIWKFIISKKNRGLYLILVVPAILTFLMIVAISPYKSIRYVMFLLPIISIGFVILLDDLIDNKIFSTTLLTIFAIFISIYGLIYNPINFLYIGYKKYIDIADEYKNDRFVIVTQTVFSQIQDVPEFQRYKETLMIDKKDLKDLKNFEEFKQDKEIILGVKNWVGSSEEILKQVMKYTGYNNYKKIYSSNNSARMTIYKLYNN